MVARKNKGIVWLDYYVPRVSINNPACQFLFERSFDYPRVVFQSVSPAVFDKHQGFSRKSHLLSWI
jgi:hypothetical protein